MNWTASFATGTQGISTFGVYPVTAQLQDLSGDIFSAEQTLLPLWPGTRAAEVANQVAAPVVRNRARELRALGEEKTREFRRSQVGRELRVLTLRDERDSAETTPALSSNYLRVGVSGKFAPNEWVNVTVAEADGLIGEPALSKPPIS